MRPLAAPGDLAGTGGHLDVGAVDGGHRAADAVEGVRTCRKSLLT